jgi:glycosyltransferase involved in cell wall biosynthesis
MEKVFKTILHLSYDYGHGEKTVAISQLVDALRELYCAEVVSIDRIVKIWRETTHANENDVLEIKSFGLPYGIFLINHLKRVHKKILRAASKNLISLNLPDIIHAHKLSFEGYIGYLLARELNKPLLVSIRQTDFYVLKHRTDLVPMMKEILRYSSTIFFIMPYMIKRLEKLFGKKFFIEEMKNKLVFLPNISDRKSIAIENACPKNYLFTVLRMTKRSVKRKNVNKLFQALSVVSDLDYELYVAGDGPYLKVLQRWVKQYNLSHKVTFLGSIPNTGIDQYFANATAFVMPSFSETFGMVYAEALMNGTPILYSKGTGFDGLFENVGVAVDPYSTDSIEKGIRELINKNDFYRDSICKLKEINAFNIFSPDHARNTYSTVLDKIVN